MLNKWVVASTTKLQRQKKVRVKNVEFKFKHTQSFMLNVLSVGVCANLNNQLYITVCAFAFRSNITPEFICIILTRYQTTFKSILFQLLVINDDYQLPIWVFLRLCYNNAKEFTSYGIFQISLHICIILLLNTEG